MVVPVRRTAQQPTRIPTVRWLGCRSRSLAKPEYDGVTVGTVRPTVIVANRPFPEDWNRRLTLTRPG